MKVKVSAQQRVREFPNNGFKIVDGKIWCDPCQREINHDKKSVVEQHLRTASHRSAHSSIAATPCISTFIGRSNRNEQRWKLMVDAFVGAGVPLHKFRNNKFREWMKLNVEEGKNMPSETTLRVYLKLQAQDDFNNTKIICRDKDIIMIADESLDIKNRKVLNILVLLAQPKSVPRLVWSLFLEKCNSTTVVQAIIDVMQALEIPLNRLLCFKTDNAPYMLKAGKKINLLCPRAMHSTCWAHILHLVSEQIRDKLEVADDYIAKFKQSLVKSPSRRKELQDIYETNGHSRALPPTPVVTRWGTWLETGAFHYGVIEAEINWIESTENDSKTINALKDIVKNPALKDELRLIKDIHPGLSSSIKLLEKRNTPSSDIWLILTTMEGIYQELSDYNSSKLQSYMQFLHPSRGFWKDVQFLDPRKADQFVHDSECHKLPESLKPFSQEAIPIEEMIIYKSIRSSSHYNSEFCPFGFWEKYSREMPKLSALALTALSIVPSSADVERSFTYLRRTLTPERNSLTEENLDAHLRLQYNSLSSKSDYSEPMDIDDSDFDLF